MILTLKTISNLQVGQSSYLRGPKAIVVTVAFASGFKTLVQDTFGTAVQDYLNQHYRA